MIRKKQYRIAGSLLFLTLFSLASCSDAMVSLYHPSDDQTQETLRETSQETRPTASIDYQNGTLTGLVGAALYTVFVDIPGEEQKEYTAEKNGSIKIAESWYNHNICIVRRSTGPDKTDSDAQYIWIREKAQSRSLSPIAAGSAHTFIFSDDKIWAAGSNGEGEFGLGNTTDKNTFTEVTGLSDRKITTFGSGEHHLIARDADGKVWASGLNTNHQLGSGYFINRPEFKEVPDLTDKKIIAFGAGFSQTFALGSDGKVWAAGDNYYGQLGLGNTSAITQFTGVPVLSGITAIAVGYSHTIALDRDGKVWVTGRNNDGQLGLGDTVNQNSFTPVTGLSGIIAIAAGHSHTIALDRDGKVWVTGRNNNGQLGLGDTVNQNSFTPVTSLDGIIAIASGHAHTIALDRNGNGGDSLPV
ncbi:hypothetical protein FACS1894124_8100 [Spirochaetia bacterium]|nr:hypothetical protein FACS1894124_8100 [Spirochaetia bacterium]